jgi:hypothetical protein
MAATTTLIDSKRVLGDGASYRVRARIDQEKLAQLVGELTVRAAEEGPLTLADGALVITAEPSGRVPESEMEALRREMQSRLPDPEEDGFLPL